jgi:glucosylglycerate synthase
MATTNPLPGAASDSAPTSARLLVLLAALPQDQLDVVLANLAACVAPESLLIATTDQAAKEAHPELSIVTVAETKPSTRSAWTITAADYVSAFQLAQDHQARAVLMLGPESGSLNQSGLRGLAEAVLTASTDLAIPHYDLPPRAGLVNSAILYPVSRALFASPARFPLAVDLGLSMRMAENLSAAAQRFTRLNQPGALLWPVNESAAAGFTIREVGVGSRAIPQPADPDLNAILPDIAGSLFSDVEAKAAFWQRARQLPLGRNHQSTAPPLSTDAPADVVPMVQAFRLAYTNLLEIWSLVLPPNSLLDLKRLSLTDGTAFRMPETLWARIVYDFLLAYRLRTINRGHLLGALIPLYLAWVASHINTAAAGVDPEQHIDAVSAAFANEKPYLVARWRWPDRFNP